MGHSLQAQVVARQVGIPCIGTVTLTGPGVIQATWLKLLEHSSLVSLPHYMGMFSQVPPMVREQWESNPGVQKARQEIKDTYDFDVFQHGTFLEFYSPDQNLVCTSDSLYVAPKTEVQLERFPHFPFECVGPLLNSKIQRLHNANVSDSDSVKLPAAVEDAVAAGKRLLYISPGTVATGHFWTEKFGPQAMGV